ncbi:MAG: amidase [Steroidobacteraceae bacterium]
MSIELQSATEQLQLLRERRIGALELLDLLLARIERLNPRLNAVVARDVEGARRAARAADDAPAGNRGPLHGLPLTIKDVWAVAGMPAACGMPELAGYVPAQDADAVARLRAAGAIPFAKTNVPYAASDHQSYNDVYGTSNNPWNLARTPGGSSGGAAAAVAAGLTSLELGSDIGGSIRCPAHFCGVYGHKPSYGIVPLRGHIPPPPGAQVVPPLPVGGPIARSARDLELALDLLVAPAEIERTAWSIRLPPSRRDTLSGFRVALWADARHYSVDARCLAAMQSYAADLRRIGVQVDEAARPEFDPAEYEALYLELLFAVMSAGMPEPLLAAVGQIAAGMPASAGAYPARIARALRTSHGRFGELLEQQAQMVLRWRAFFERHDVLLCPIMPTVAYAHDHTVAGPGPASQFLRTISVDDRPVPYLAGLQWPGVATLANLPATALPTGRRVDGLPVGMQAIGPYLEDRTPLRFAQLVERELGGYRAPPEAS